MRFVGSHERSKESMNNGLVTRKHRPQLNPLCRHRARHEQIASRLRPRKDHGSPRSLAICPGRLDLTASIRNSARQCRISSNLTSSLLEAGLRSEPSFRRQRFCSCMRRLPRRSWKPQPRPVKGGTRQPFRRESLRQQESSSMVLSRLAGRRVALYTPESSDRSHH
jgi:hypothetical protein